MVILARWLVKQTSEENEDRRCRDRDRSSRVRRSET